MKSMIILTFLLVFTSFGYGQQNKILPDQNPRFHISLDRYLNEKNTYVLLQGTTLQETYKAIDPLEDKREQRAFRRKLKNFRPLWRHQRRIERIRNSRYYNFGGYYWNDWHYNDWYTAGLLFDIGLSACFGF